MKQISVIILINAVLCLGGCVSESNDKIVNHVKVGDAVPKFTVKGTNGTGNVTFEAGDFEGQRSVIVFFQTTCGDCRREMPKVYEAWRYFADTEVYPPVQFILVSRGESAAAVADYWASETETKPSFESMPYYLDPGRVAYDKFANSYVPRLYLVGSNGRVKYMAIETFDFDGWDLIDKINNLQ
jgi:thiol-disulfide isomerase/thioredoxin